MNIARWRAPSAPLAFLLASFRAYGRRPKPTASGIIARTIIGTFGRIIGVTPRKDMQRSNDLSML
jgi:hypothetical protein